MTKIPAYLRPGASSPRRLVQIALITLSALGANNAYLVAADTIAAAGTAVISGIVTNQSTGNGLEGAKVEIPQIGASALVDKTGRYLLNVPAGMHELVVTYTGMDPQRSTVTAASPRR
jgi:hypothetical protein